MECIKYQISFAISHYRQHITGHNIIGSQKVKVILWTGLTLQMNQLLRMKKKIDEDLIFTYKLRSDGLIDRQFGIVPMALENFGAELS